MIRLLIQFNELSGFFVINREFFLVQQEMDGCNGCEFADEDTEQFKFFCEII